MRNELPRALKKTGERISFWGPGPLGWVGYEGEVFELFGVRVVVHLVEHGKWVVSEPTLGLRFPDGVGATKSEALEKAFVIATAHRGRRWFDARTIERAKALIALNYSGRKPRRAAVAGLIIDRPGLARRSA